MDAGDLLEPAHELLGGNCPDVRADHASLRRHDHVGGHRTDAELGGNIGKLRPIDPHGDVISGDRVCHVRAAEDIAVHASAGRASFAPEVDQDQPIRLRRHGPGRIERRLPLDRGGRAGA